MKYSFKHADITFEDGILIINSTKNTYHHGHDDITAELNPDGALVVKGLYHPIGFNEPTLGVSKSIDEVDPSKVLTKSPWYLKIAKCLGIVKSDEVKYVAKGWVLLNQPKVEKIYISNNYLIIQ